MLEIHSRNTPRWRALSSALFVCGLVGLAVAIFDLTGHSFHLRVLGVRVSSWEAYKPFRIGVMAFVAALWLRDHVSSRHLTTWHRLPRLAPWIGGAAALASTAIAIQFGIFAAGGADAYGYVSQAYLWAAGQLTVSNPLHAVTNAIGPATVPLGYQLAGDPRWMVPTYPPGLPMMMAVALKLGGPSAVYFVVPLLAGATVWITYVIATRLADRRVAMMAALLVAFSPIVICQSLEPMSDVPATAFWMAAWLAAISPGRWAPLAAGVAVSAAILTRPNLAPLAIVPAFLVWHGANRESNADDRARVFAGTSRWSRAVWFAAGALPSCFFIAALNDHLYGSPLRSGYGPLATLYAWNRFDDNLRRYVSWLVELHTPLVLLAFAAPFVARVRKTLPMLAFAGLLFLAYAFYIVFDTWPFVRFLLPAIPLLLILCSAVMVAGIARLPIAFRSGVYLLVCTLVPAFFLLTSRNLTIFALHRAEHRYVAVGKAANALEPNAVFLTIVQSGNVRLYGDRATVRWDLVAPDRLDFTLKTLRDAGYVPYIILEDWDEQPFRERFGGASEIGRVDWPPMLQYDGASTTRIYAVDDRARYKAGDCIETRLIEPAARPESRTSPPCASPKS